eukprot:3214221-Pyramimonas_sp.AAC.2
MGGRGRMSDVDASAPNLSFPPSLSSSSSSFSSFFFLHRWRPKTALKNHANREQRRRRHDN